MPSIRRYSSKIVTLLIIGILATHPFLINAQTSPITITVDTRRAVNRFDPEHALGGGIDGHDTGELRQQLTPANIKEMLSTGLKSLSYRLRTELSNDAWHWNPNGTWSEPNNKQGYWTSAAAGTGSIEASYGYRLTRRGNTIDNANNDGYSRLDDGDIDTFWKSNPYLDRHFTKEPSSFHPQWIVIEFNEPRSINALRVLWGDPYARSCKIQYGEFGDISDIALNPAGKWHDFPGGRHILPIKRNSTSSPDLIRLSNRAIKTRFVRILMTVSSGTAPAGSTDIRDRLGFAVREIYLGSVDATGQFHDELRHGTKRDTQTIMHVSSTDPWHREIDRDEGVEQPGFDLVYTSGLTNNLPPLLSLGVLFDTPDNNANAIRYLRSRGYEFTRLELGEEPDGQYVPPADFGALYLQSVNAIRKVDPTVEFGGPSFQEIQPGEEPPQDRRGNSLWLQRLMQYLRSHHRAHDYSFFSFEWYPFDDVCEPVAPQLARSTSMLTKALVEMQRRGLSRNTPWIISEYGYSAFPSRAEVGIEGALLNADIVGRFLTLGGEQAFLYGYTPSEVIVEGCSPGQNMLFSKDDDGKIIHYLATYFGAKLLTHEWTMPEGGKHELYPASVDLKNGPGEEIVTAYALYRPDDQWSLLLINKDPKRSFSATVRFLSRQFSGPLDVYQFSPEQYQLNDDHNNPFPVKADPPEHRVINNHEPLTLPAYSLTILRGRIEPGRKTKQL